MHIRGLTKMKKGGKADGGDKFAKGFFGNRATRALMTGANPTYANTLALGQHDPDGQARAIAYRSYDGTLTIGSGRGGGRVRAL